MSIEDLTSELKDITVLELEYLVLSLEIDKKLSVDEAIKLIKQQRTEDERNIRASS